MADQDHNAPNPSCAHALAADAPAAARDARLLELLTATREADGLIRDAYNQTRDDLPEAVLAPVYLRLAELQAEMARIPSDGAAGIMAKAARLCDALAEDGFNAEGTSLGRREMPIAASLADDLARLLPQAVRA
jgi:hypothetical protein